MRTNSGGPPIRRLSVGCSARGLGGVRASGGAQSAANTTGPACCHRGSIARNASTWAFAKTLFDHTALRAPPWAFTLHSGCSHHQHHVSAHALSSPKGIGILAPAPRCDHRAGGRRPRRTPPPHTLATHRVRTRHGSLAGSPVLLTQYIHSVQSSHCHPLAGSPLPVHPLSTIIAAAAPVEGGRDVGNQWAAAVPPPSEPRGPGHPEGWALTAAAPRAASPTQSRATRDGPNETLQLRRQRRGASPQKPVTRGVLAALRYTRDGDSNGTIAVP